MDECLNGDFNMDNFQKIKATARSLSRRKLVYGFGVNNSWFKVYSTINEKQVVYTPYQTWMGMLKRCYSSTYQEKHPTYIGCIVCDDWLTFSVFEAWMVKQDWKGNQLDKDIIEQGNKLYAPEYCRFIPQALNSLLVARDASRGLYPLGVCWYKRDNVYKSEIAINGKSKHLGYFKTVQEAKAVYDKAKYAEIRRHALMQDDPAIKAGLLDWVVA